MIATGLVVPTIPYYAKRLDMHASAQGSLMSLYGILQLGGSPICTSLLLHSVFCNVPHPMPLESVTVHRNLFLTLPLSCVVVSGSNI